MTFNHFYYLLKPLIPRRLQIELRRIIVRKKRARYADIWPIDPRSGLPPEEWTGWPDGKKFALVLTHDVETAKGHENCRKLMELDEKLRFRSSFGFVPERYSVSPELRKDLQQRGFEISVHGLSHDGLYYWSREVFRRRAVRINRYLKDWGAVGFRSPSMLHNLDWLHDLKIKYDSSTFDTDPFEPQPEGVGTIFPFWVSQDGKKDGYVEIPYTLPQDHSLFVIMQEKTIHIWEKKLDWISAKGGIALLITHPDYMNFGGAGRSIDEYPVNLYAEFLEYVTSRYRGKYWNPLPKEMARFWNSRNGTGPAGEKG
jgi:peptidoglycan/xylan/chitin deacetylase (PgdA/CDA1 family)